MTRTLEDFGQLWPAEQRLVEWILAGNMDHCSISDDLPSENAPKEVRLRASFVRYLALGGSDDCRVPEKGLRVIGAYIDGDGKDWAETRGLDLEGCDLPRDLTLFGCRFPDLLMLRGARLRSLFLDGSYIHAGLSADGLEAKGGVFLRGLVAEGGVRLRGALIRGNLECDGARLSARVGGEALSGAGMRLKGTFFLRARACVDGVLDPSGAQIGEFTDDLACWPQRDGDLLLNRCRYGAFNGPSPVNAKSRIRWLSLQNERRWGATFWPQPWEECARVLREMGYGAAAREILIEKEKRQRAARRIEVWNRSLNLGPMMALALWLVDGTLNLTIRYGRQPMLAFAWLAGFLIIGWAMFAFAEAQGALKPNLPQIERAPEWVQCASGGRLRGDQPSQYACYVQQPAGQSYPHFNPFIYSADTLIPVVGFEMQAYWLPDERDDFGKLARWYLWLHIAMGWGLTLLAVAGFSGLIKQDSK